MSSAAGAALEPALLYEPAIPAGRNLVITPAADDRPDLTHAVAIPDLRKGVVAHVSDNLLPAPVVNAHQNVAIVQNARD